MAVCACTAGVNLKQDEIRELAKKAGFLTGLKDNNEPFIWHLFFDDDNLFAEMEQFANLVAAKEREACAKVAEATKAPFTSFAIRARGQK